ncbi:hypothetical protein JRO89_XS05G0244900 [Xanthoceras sorbifolium]|uniref:Uncharacterized protein n=1 Tax=Xanthoceras sorbifolium TaxID=99658 RepID=A0ABQ8I346_9ROSI|nr:hypothetical protein JRO89_XS05G0244900 [Xanthoceras sorbifolium]
MSRKINRDKRKYEKFDDINSLVMKDFWVRAGSLLEEFAVAGGQKSVDQVSADSISAGPSSAAGAFCWSPPSVGFKINVDTAIDSPQKRFGVGVIIRNVLGVPIFAAARCFEVLYGVEAAEASAIVDVRFLLELYPFFSVSPRLGNFVAHGLAKWAVGSVSSCCWASSFPEWLLKLIRVDGGSVCSSCAVYSYESRKILPDS